MAWPRERCLITLMVVRRNCDPSRGTQFLGRLQRIARADQKDRGSRILRLESQLVASIAPVKKVKKYWSVRVAFIIEH